MARTPQSFAHHLRLDPPFHFFIVPVAFITLIAIGVRLYRAPSLWNAWFVIAAIAALVAVFKIRLYALKVQDRVIRLEERLRLAAVLPEPLRARVGELQEAQLIGLRFACDAELAALVERSLRENLTRKQIKQAVVTWRPDYHRI